MSSLTHNKDLSGKLLLANQDFYPWSSQGKPTNKYIPETSTVLCTRMLDNFQLEFIHDGIIYKSNHWNFIPISPGNKLYKQNFVLTGTLNYNRPVYEALIKLHNGNVKSTVNKSTHFLIQGDTNRHKPSSKLNDAHKHNVSIITENGLYSLLNL